MGDGEGGNGSRTGESSIKNLKKSVLGGKG